MKKLIIFFVSFIFAMIVGITIGLNIPSSFEVLSNWSKFNVAFSFLGGFIFAIIVVIIEIIIFSKIDKKKIKENKQQNSFYIGRIVNTITEDMAGTIYYAICVDVETETDIYHLSKTFFLNEEQHSNFESAIKERKIDSMKVYVGNLSSVSFEFDFDDFYQRAGLNTNPEFIELKPNGSGMSKTKK